MTPQDIDRYVSKQLTYWRKKRGYSQIVLGEHLGVSFQQIQKYERGINRIGPGRLFLAAQVLDIPIEILFPDQFHINNTQTKT